MRKTIYTIIECNDTKLGKAYDYFMIFSIISSILPLCFIEQTSLLITIDKITTFIFIIDYLLRFLVADYTSSKHKNSAFILYFFRPMAIIDILSIIPTIFNLNHAFKVFKIFRLLRTLRVFKVLRYSKNLKIIKNVILRKKDALLVVGGLALGYIFISALVVFQVEPHTFKNFFEAIYWSTVSLTTVGYGDIYPVSDIGRILSMISSFLGIAIVALPSGIIISGYQEEIETLNQ